MSQSSSALSRRGFLRAAAAASAAFGGLARFDASAAAALDGSAEGSAGYGPLVTDPHGIIELPEGFTYRILSRAGEVMNDGLILPGAPDGMAAFPGPGGRVVLVRNHELANAPAGRGAFGWRRELVGRVPVSKLYDAGADREPTVPGARPGLGGCTTLVYDPATGQTVHQHLSLAGTERNCAGGHTPWGSWITCEETTHSAGEDGRGEDHGYNFEVPASGDSGLADPVPLRAMGRFNHEAVAVEPASGIVYQTEDRQDGLITRFLPNEPGNLPAGGRLQALSVADRPSLDTRNWIDNHAQAQAGGSAQAAGGAVGGPTLAQNEVVEVRWIDLDDVDTPADDLRYRAFDAGAARFARAEGIWHSDRGVFIACTTGGRERIGQIFRYVPSRFEGQAEEARFPGRLELFLEPNDHTLVKNADNLTIHPNGHLVVCEDAGQGNRLVGVTPAGRLYPLGRNVVSKSEFAGSCFSPDGSTLFVNIQADGLTLAIQGFAA
ncbi:alkaline phosphatase PhoX [Phycisphaera mikurensis]|uniref:Phosphatase n=1 Tax=Phycisphaera mikurensis (strain NBRC 102666 / KCTC 22515 / FYK2301M01) TaxID=1142394 RepID=I0IFF3_PHYMF|nr:alkaline phosphatase PhoX [Phycisphaera mikurensis]MBB6440617.1 hypothetical protein [Phycisphaera mikurensis]BAM03991.1 hypothetical protein PSMK_18320 [Phycisphaera mikurensis NBRC 102666]